jgi:S1-C subfamily serine protease
MATFGIDQLREATVKILGFDGKTAAGAGFIIRSDGYLITCHHVIYQLEQLRVDDKN